MSIFKKKYDKELDALLTEMKMDASNNYKDNAQRTFQKFKDRMDEMQEAGLLNDRQLAYYTELREQYDKELMGFHH